MRRKLRWHLLCPKMTLQAEHLLLPQCGGAGYQPGWAQLGWCGLGAEGLLALFAAQHFLAALAY